MPSPDRCTVILGTGGTIAGTAASSQDNVGYRAAQLGVAALVAAVPALAAWPLEADQLAQIDSKDMSHAVWQLLARPEVGCIVVTHGTDTLEETACFLHRVLAPAKPVVLTAAMRPATSLQADGPQNLLDAVTLAREPGARGVMALVGGRAFAAEGLRKVDAYRLDAFAGVEVARVEEGRVRTLAPWPEGRALGVDHVAAPVERWPRVAWITAHAGFDGALVDAALAAGFGGLVVAGTGNGTLHADLAAALERARAAGVAVRVTTRCESGRVIGGAPDQPIGPAQARVALLLELLGR